MQSCEKRTSASRRPARPSHPVGGYGYGLAVSLIIYQTKVMTHDS